MLSVHLLILNVKANGLQSLQVFLFSFLGMEIMVYLEGMPGSKSWRKILVNTSSSWLEQSLRSLHLSLSQG